MHPPAGAWGEAADTAPSRFVISAKGVPSSIHLLHCPWTGPGEKRRALFPVFSLLFRLWSEQFAFSGSTVLYTIYTYNKRTVLF